MMKSYFNKDQNMPYINLTIKYPDWIFRIRLVHFLTIFILVVSTLIILSSWKNNLVILIQILMFFLIYKANKYFKALRKKVEKKFYWQNKLIYFIKSNHLYREDSEEYQEVDKNGNTKIKIRKYISSSAVFSYKETTNKIIIYAIKRGDGFGERVTKMEVEISGLLNLPLEEKIDRPGVCEYHYFIKRPERLYVTSSSYEKQNDSLDINLGYEIIYNPVECPHILIAGGTGSGKSIFISFMILEFLKQNSSIWLCDYKNSDLGSLSHYLGDERVATSSNNIARVVRLVITEMQKRYDYMNENFKYGSNFVDHGFKSVWLLFDEMGAFQASGTDKKSKEVVTEVMDGIKQIILLGRQAGVFILIAAQQMNANTLNTDLRDNLGLRIAFGGGNSSEGLRMVFGGNIPDAIPLIRTKGSGMLYMQSSGKETAQYWESPYVDMKKFDFIKELNRYC